jgi:pimeloyl-ACP methyl ester carboxylesterase
MRYFLRLTRVVIMKRWNSIPSAAADAASASGSDRTSSARRRSNPSAFEFALHPAVAGERHTLRARRAGHISWYQDGPPPARGCAPLLLIHGISAASSAFDMKPLYDHYRRHRCVYALDLPGFGFSARVDRHYNPRLMTDAIHELLEHIRQSYVYAPVDAVALSLSCEFLARAAVENSAAFRSLAFISPTGLEKPMLRDGRAGSTLEKRWLRDFSRRSRWRRPLYDLLTRPASVRFFLQRAFGSRRVDPGLVDYDVALSRQAGAEFAPMHFLAGSLFSGDSGRLYRGLKRPVWLTHGTRGAFSNLPGIAALSDRPNWTIEGLQSGAMPQWELPEEWTRRYDGWLSGLSQTSFPHVEWARADPSTPPRAESA